MRSLYISHWLEGQWNIKLSPSMQLRVSKQVGYHVLFWGIYFAFNVLRWGSYFNDYSYSFKSNLIGFPIHIFLAYLNAYYLLPKFIPKGQYLRYFGALTLALSAMFLVKVYLNYYLVSPVVWPESYKAEEIFGANHIITVMLGELYVIGLTTSIKLTMDWLYHQRRTKALETKNLETELDLLKSQIQPHFFFNTLNNLYALTLDKSDKAPETVLKLSELMSYILYQASNTRKVSLSKEIVQMQHYLDLEQLRFGKRLNLSFEIQGNIERVEIAPLILLPFIENTFKHGVHNQITTIDIQMNLQVGDQWLDFTIINPKPPLPAYLPQGLTLEKPVGGVGLKNAKRRLELIYKDKFQLNIYNEEDRYKVHLRIPSSPDAILQNTAEQTAPLGHPSL